MKTGWLAEKKVKKDYFDNQPTKKQKRWLKKLGINSWATDKQLAAEIIAASVANGGKCPEKYLKQFSNVRRERILPPEPPPPVVWCTETDPNAWWDDSELGEGWESEEIDDGTLDPGTSEASTGDEEDGEGDQPGEAEDLEAF